MSAEAFLDTNILLYAISTDPAERAKRHRSRDLLASPHIGFSTQVFSEFYDNATRKLQPRLTHHQALAILEPLRSLPVQPITLEVLWRAFRLRERFHLSFWDASIVAAAAALGCQTLWSEDLSHGQNYDGVKALNPFRS